MDSRNERIITRDDIKNADPRMLFGAMVATVGLEKTKLIFNCYLEEKESMQRLEKERHEYEISHN